VVLSVQRGIFVYCRNTKMIDPSTIYTGCPGGNVPDFGRMFLTLKYTDITQNTYIRGWKVTEIMAREQIPVSLQSANNNRHFTCRPIYIFDHISLSSSQNEKCFTQKLYRKSKHTVCVQ